MSRDAPAPFAVKVGKGRTSQILEEISSRRGTAEESFWVIKSPPEGQQVGGQGEWPRRMPVLIPSPSCTALLHGQLAAGPIHQIFQSQTNYHVL